MFRRRTFNLNGYYPKSILSVSNTKSKYVKNKTLKNELKYLDIWP